MRSFLLILVLSCCAARCATFVSTSAVSHAALIVSGSLPPLCASWVLICELFAIAANSPSTEDCDTPLPFTVRAAGGSDEQPTAIKARTATPASARMRTVPKRGMADQSSAPTPPRGHQGGSFAGSPRTRPKQGECVHDGPASPVRDCGVRPRGDRGDPGRAERWGGNPAYRQERRRDGTTGGRALRQGRRR